MKKFATMTSANHRAFLFDLDGVVLNQPKLMQHISDRVGKYVSKRLNVSREEGDRINRVLYKEYGHTHVGMRRVYDIRDTALQFSSYIYDKDTMSYMESFKDDQILQERGRDTRSILKRMKEDGSPALIFSNAPMIWCLTALNMMGIIDEYILEYDVIASDHPLMLMNGGPDCLKPVPAAYKIISDYVNKCNAFKGNNHDFVMIDDSFRNLVPIIGRANWHGVHFKNRDVDWPLIRNERLTTIEEMTDMHDVLDAVECRMVQKVE
jgi:FMN phosphatase YigB (HAD superfamily)